MEFAFSREKFEFQGVGFKRRNVSCFSLVELNYSPNIEISAHAHEHANFCMALEGGCTEIYGAKKREYKPFTLGYLPPFQTHSLKTSTNGMRAFSIDISSQWLKRINEYSLKVEDAVYCPGGILIELITRLYYEFQNTDEATPLVVEGLALEMLAQVSRYQVRESSSPRWLRRARDIIHEQFSLNLSLDIIAREIGVHPVHLGRTFRNHYGCSIGEYIRRMRVEEACREIIASEISLSEIALKTGFSDQSHFTRIFRRQKGLTPAEYRSEFKIF